MKTTLSCILASIAIALTAAASPSLRIDMTVATSGNRIVHRPSLFTQSGKQAIISSGDQESALTCALTPTLLDNGSVEIQAVITQREGKKTDRHFRRILVRLGKVAKFKVGELRFTAKPIVVK